MTVISLLEKKAEILRGNESAYEISCLSVSCDGLLKLLGLILWVL